MRWLHLGFTLKSRAPWITWGDEAGRSTVREQTSAIPFSLEDSQEELTFIPSCIMCRWTPCAQRSNGAIGHRALLIQEQAETLSTKRVVKVPLQSSAKVSHVIRAEINSATLIWITPGARPGKRLTRIHSSHADCQNNPSAPGWAWLWSRKSITPAIPQLELASLNNTAVFAGS